jgi:hypothetical protein
VDKNAHEALNGKREDVAALPCLTKAAIQQRPGPACILRGLVLREADYETLSGLVNRLRPRTFALSHRQSRLRPILTRSRWRT